MSRTQRTRLSASPRGSQSRLRKGFLGGVAFTATLGLLGWLLAFITSYQPIGHGSFSSVSPDAIDISVGGDDVAQPAFIAGGHLDYKFSIRNDGRFPVSVLGFEDHNTGFLWVTEVKVQPEQMKDRCLGCRDLMVPERPFRLEPGAQAAFWVTARFALCSETEPGVGSDLDQVGIRYRAFGLESAAAVNLRSYFSIKTPTSVNGSFQRQSTDCHEIGEDRADDRSARIKCPCLPASVVMVWEPEWEIGFHIRPSDRDPTRFDQCRITVNDGTEKGGFEANVGSARANRAVYIPASRLRGPDVTAWDPMGSPADEIDLTSRARGQSWAYRMSVAPYADFVASA